MTASSEPFLRQARLRWLVLPLFWAVLAGLALGGVEARYSATALAVLLTLYLLLASTLYLAVAASRLLGSAMGFAAAAGACGILVWHCRELTYRPSSLAAVPALALVLAVPLHLLTARSLPRSSPAKAWLAAAGAGLCTVLAVAAAFRTGELRWHLLRHNKMLGTAAYYALADRIVEHRRELFDRHRDGAGGAGKEEAPRGMKETDAREADGGEGSMTVEPPPDLVFILLDTLRADALEMGGGPRDAMPRLNAWIDEGYRMTNVIANASWTRPSMASMFTGLLPEEHGARDVDDPLAEEFITVAEILGDQGFETAAFVSNVGAVGRSAGFAQGFDFFHEFRASPYARAAQIRRTVEEWLDRREASNAGSERPLFLYLHFLDPHEPYLAGRTPASKSRREYHAAYRQELRYLDGELGRLFDLLEARLEGPVAYLVTSDHGEEFGEHEEFGHGYSLYDEVIRVPLAIRTGRGGGELHEPLEGRDVFDLVASWSAAGGQLDVPAWAGARSRPRRYASVYYSSAGRLLLRPYLEQVCMRTVESEGHKLIWSAYGPTYELYDVGTDPAEQHNLAAERPGLVERLSALFDPGVGQWSFPAPYERSPEELEQLEALGYAGD